MDYEKFIRNRISEFCIKANISETKLSYEIDHAHGYINSITTGKMLPSMKEFLTICDYFEISPSSFFDVDLKSPTLVSAFFEQIKDFSDEDLGAILHIVERMQK